MSVLIVSGEFISCNSAAVEVNTTCGAVWWRLASPNQEPWSPRPRFSIECTDLRIHAAISTLSLASPHFHEE